MIKIRVGKAGPCAKDDSRPNLRGHAQARGGQRDVGYHRAQLQRQRVHDFAAQSRGAVVTFSSIDVAKSRFMFRFALSIIFLGPVSINAQPIDEKKYGSITADTDCRKYGVDTVGLSAKCENRKGVLIELRNRKLKNDLQQKEVDIARLEKQSAAAKREEAASIAITSCVEKIKSEVVAILADRPLSEREKLNFRTRQENCERPAVP